MNFAEQKKRLVAHWKAQGISENILHAFLAIPREHFVPQKLRDLAYADEPLPLAQHSTISQPKTVMLMLSWLCPQKEDKILEIGTGSGYHAALLSKLCKEVISLEVNGDLVCEAKKRITELGITNVSIVHTTGMQGFSEKAPYDKIVVTAACKNIPLVLIEQLKEKGVLLIPVGVGIQKMVRVIKEKGRITEESLGDFAFVELQE